METTQLFAKKSEIRKEEAAAPEIIQTQSKKVVITVFAYKGDSKTYSSFSIPAKNDKVLAISFDGMTRIIAEQFFAGQDITVYDAIDSVKRPLYPLKMNGGKVTVEQSTENGSANMMNLLKFAYEMPDNTYDFIIADGMNLCEKLAEAVMRYNHGVKFNAGCEWNWWDERNSIVNGLHSLFLNKAKKGVIYTVYPMNNDTLIEGERVINRSEVPKWAGDLLYQTLILLRMTKRYNKADNKNHYYARVETSKLKKVPSGVEYDITDKYLRDVLVW